MSRPKIRLHVEHPLSAGQTVDLSRDQANYLFAVMRLGPGDGVALFNGRDGEWRASVAQAGKRAGVLSVETQTAPQQDPPDLWLLFAPIKKARTDFIVEKATELGAARIMPVQTEFTNAERIRRDRLQAHAVEAAEQCGGTYVPPVDDLARLSDVLADWPADRQLVFADEALVGAKRALSDAAPRRDQMGDPGRSRGRFFRGRARAAARAALRDAGLSWAEGAARRHGGRRGPDALAVGARGLAMSGGFLRPEAAATLRRWREPLIALAMIALGIWIAARPGPIVQGFGWVLAAVGGRGLDPRHPARAVPGLGRGAGHRAGG